MNKDKSLNQRINKLVTSEDVDEVQQIYRDWAATYESDLDEHGYVAPQTATEQFSQLVADKNAVIFDAGCGTGLVGKLLRSHGFAHIHGADFSSDMLAEAEKAGAYENLRHADFGAAIEIPDASYDAIISVGVYTARFQGQFIPEMLRILKPGGVFLFTCRELYYEKEVHQELSMLTGSGAVSESDVALKPYILAENAQAYYIVLNKPPV